jgi:hypothetical protein
MSTVVVEAGKHRLAFALQWRATTPTKRELQDAVAYGAKFGSKRANRVSSHGTVMYGYADNSAAPGTHAAAAAFGRETRTGLNLLLICLTGDQVATILTKDGLPLPLEDQVHPDISAAIQHLASWFSTSDASTSCRIFTDVHSTHIDKIIDPSRVAEVVPASIQWLDKLASTHTLINELKKPGVAPVVSIALILSVVALVGGAIGWKIFHDHKMQVARAKQQKDPVPKYIADVAEQLSSVTDPQATRGVASYMAAVSKIPSVVAQWTLKKVDCQNKNCVVTYQRTNTATATNQALLDALPAFMKQVDFSFDGETANCRIEMPATGFEAPKMDPATLPLTQPFLLDVGSFFEALKSRKGIDSAKSDTPGYLVEVPQGTTMDRLPYVVQKGAWSVVGLDVTRWMTDMPEFMTLQSLTVEPAESAFKYTLTGAYYVRQK